MTRLRVITFKSGLFIIFSHFPTASAYLEGVFLFNLLEVVKVFKNPENHPRKILDYTTVPLETIYIQIPFLDSCVSQENYIQKNSKQQICTIVKYAFISCFLLMNASLLIVYKHKLSF